MDFVCPSNAEMSVLNFEAFHYSFHFDLNVKSSMKTSPDISSIINKTSVFAKYVKQYFNADKFIGNNGQMKYTDTTN